MREERVLQNKAGGMRTETKRGRIAEVMKVI